MGRRSAQIAAGHDEQVTLARFEELYALRTPATRAVPALAGGRV